MITRLKLIESLKYGLKMMGCQTKKIENQFHVASEWVIIFFDRMGYN